MKQWWTVACATLAMSACSSGIQDGYYWSKNTTIFKVTSNGDQVSLEVRDRGVPKAHTFAMTRQGDALTTSDPLFGTISVGKTEGGIHVVGFNTERDAIKTTEQKKTPAATPVRGAAALAKLKAEMVTCIAQEMCGGKLDAEQKELLTKWSEQLMLEKTTASTETVVGPVHSTVVTLTVNAGPVETENLQAPAHGFDVEARIDALDFAEVPDEHVQLLRFDGRGGRNGTNGESVTWLASDGVLGDLRRGGGIVSRKKATK